MCSSDLLSLCEIRILEAKRTLKPEEVPKIKKKPEKITPTTRENKEEGEVLDQLKEKIGRASCRERV